MIKKNLDPLSIAIVVLMVVVIIWFVLKVAGVDV